MPAGGVLISEPIARYFDDHFFAGGLTYSGHPLAMAAIVATIDAMKEEKVVENAASIGNEVLRPGLEALAEKHAIIGEVRGRGLFQALELVSSREQKNAADHRRHGRDQRGLNRGRAVGLCGGEPHSRGAAVHHYC